MRIATLVLAAGTSRRMGRPKQTLPVGDRTLLELTLDAAFGQPGAEVYVVTGEASPAIDAILENYPGAERRCHAEYRAGMGSSLAALVAAVPSEVTGYLILLVDQPNLTATYLNELTTAFRNDAGTKIHLTAWPERDRTGPPVVLPAALRPELLQLTGDRGARDLIRSYADQTTVHHPPEPLFDLDTEEDYERFLRLRQDRTTDT